MAASGDEVVELIAECLCKAHRFTAEAPQSSLPLRAATCHCDSCRHLTGALCSSGAEWPGNFDELRNSPLKRYVFSEKISVLFCGTCSSQIFFEQRRDEGGAPTYGVVTGALTNINVPDLVKFGHHLFLGDTLDGGSSPWLGRVNKDGTKPRLWKGHREKSEELSGDWPPVDSLPDAPDRTNGDEIHIRCHCKGVDLILRPSPDRFAKTPKAELPWYVDPSTHKLMANFEACDSCRLSSGSDVFYWTFAHPSQLSFAGLPADEQTGFPRSGPELKAAVSKGDPRFGTLTYYSSSPGVQRYFCSRCAACVIYAADDRPDVFDIAIGVLESPDGARAEGYLSWAFGSHMAWRGDTAGGWREGVIDAILSEAEKWRIARKYPKNWHRVAMEEAQAGNAK